MNAPEEETGTGGGRYPTPTFEKPRLKESIISCSRKFVGLILIRYNFL
ncbi:unnamed protein product [Musa acuminata subsp. malaccensis]|uniref:(wild Malaysian banana) hypothetical protein n=1 Tax=Musa acuminata subsp. malaccensis TaxID=214687 RepID=A0A8D7AG00_MUSAM|nr:unnamed protein product [Musa acuminata subsp. malaccensis]